MNQTTIGERIKYHRKAPRHDTGSSLPSASASARRRSASGRTTCPARIFPSCRSWPRCSASRSTSCSARTSRCTRPSRSARTKGVEFNVSLGKGKNTVCCSRSMSSCSARCCWSTCCCRTRRPGGRCSGRPFLIYVGISGLCEHFSRFRNGRDRDRPDLFVNAYHALPLPASAGRSSFRSALCSGASVCSAIIISKRTANTARS